MISLPIPLPLPLPTLVLATILISSSSLPNSSSSSLPTKSSKSGLEAFESCPPFEGNLTEGCILAEFFPLIGGGGLTLMLSSVSIEVGFGRDFGLDVLVADLTIVYKSQHLSLTPRNQDRRWKSSQIEINSLVPRTWTSTNVLMSRQCRFPAKRLDITLLALERFYSFMRSSMSCQRRRIAEQSLTIAARMRFIARMYSGMNCQCRSLMHKKLSVSNNCTSNLVIDDSLE